MAKDRSVEQKQPRRRRTRLQREMLNAQLAFDAADERADVKEMETGKTLSELYRLIKDPFQD